MSYNRYKKFKIDGEIKIVPFIEVPVKNTDKYVIFHPWKDRLDKLSYDAYGDPNYGWLILQANPSAGSLEFNIEDGTRLRIPYPLSSSIESYIEMIDLYNELN